MVYAHPDDESFGNAGTILRYASAGVAVHYACATRGESGTVAPEFLQNYPDVADLRTAELDCAARVLGLSAVHLLGYRDSGMQGSSDNLNPAALYQAPLERVTGQVVALMRLLGKDPRHFGTNNDIDMVRAVAETTPYTTFVDTRAFLAQKEHAWECHHSQLAGMSGYRGLTRPMRRFLMSREQFTRVIPSWDGRRAKERGLFAGIDA